MIYFIIAVVVDIISIVNPIVFYSIFKVNINDPPLWLGIQNENMALEIRSFLSNIIIISTLKIPMRNKDYVELTSSDIIDTDDEDVSIDGLFPFSPL